MPEGTAWQRQLGFSLGFPISSSFSAQGWPLDDVQYLKRVIYSSSEETFEMLSLMWDPYHVWTLFFPVFFFFPAISHCIFLPKTSECVFIPRRCTHKRSTHHALSNAECANALRLSGYHGRQKLLCYEAVVLALLGAAEFGHSVWVDVIIRGWDDVFVYLPDTHPFGQVWKRRAKIDGYLRRT